MMPRDYEDHREWDYTDIDIDDFNTSLYTALDVLDAADDYNGDYEHSLDYHDINGMESSLTDEEEDEHRNNSDSSSSGVSGAASAAANAVSAIVRSFVIIATGAAIITGSYQKSLAIRNAEATDTSGENAGIESTDDSYSDGDNFGSGADGENADETSHNFILSKTSGGEGSGTIIYTYVCDNCGKEITVEVNVGSKKLEQEENETENDR